MSERITITGVELVLSEPTVVVGFVIYGILSLVLIIHYGIGLYKKFDTKIPDTVKEKIKVYKGKIKDSVEESETMNLIKTGYKSFKDKTCVFIEVKD